MRLSSSCAHLISHDSCPKGLRANVGDDVAGGDMVASLVQSAETCSALECNSVAGDIHVEVSVYCAPLDGGNISQLLGFLGD